MAVAPIMMVVQYEFARPPDFNPIGLVDFVLKIVELPQSDVDQGIFPTEADNFIGHVISIIFKRADDISHLQI